MSLNKKQRILFFLFLPTSTAFSAPEVGKHVTNNLDAVSMILSLLLVLVFIVIAAFLLKKFNVSLPQRQGLKVVSSLHLSAKEKVVVLQVGDKQMLLGVTAHQITKLGTLDEPIDLANKVDGGMPNNTTSDMFSTLQRIFKK